jgi:glycosyltransferase involved in cell wall biosynthesis
VANTAGAEEELQRVLGVERRRIHRIMLLAPPPLDALRAVPLDVEPPRRRPVFVFVGQLIPRKNVDLLLTATKQLAASGRDVEVWVAGAGPLEGQLRARADTLGIGRAVRFLGPVSYSSVGFVLDAADVFVMPTSRDYRSVAVLEALRCGRPVIDSSVDGNAGDTVRDGDNGLVFQAGDASGLADCMARFVDEPELAKRMGRRARESVARHTPDRAANELYELISGLRPRVRSAGRRRHPPAWRRGRA